jgi:very-short-patch-repair endonuclease
VLCYTKDSKRLSQKLRKEMTSYEKHLWYDFLRSYPVQFRRQKPFATYVVDFYCAKAKLVVELDGEHHWDEEEQFHDEQRDKYLNSIGLRVLRFSNHQLMDNFSEVCGMIDRTVKERT